LTVRLDGQKNGFGVVAGRVCPRREGAKAVTTVRTVIHDRRIEIPAPADLADGTEVILTIGTDVADDDGPMSPAEITRVLAAMGRLQPLEIPDDVAADLDAWERKLNQRGIEYTDEDSEDVSR
jgi:hypothetical protein